jgi:hypothetical protein
MNPQIRHSPEKCSKCRNVHTKYRTSEDYVNRQNAESRNLSLSRFDRRWYSAMASVGFGFGGLCYFFEALVRAFRHGVEFTRERSYQNPHVDPSPRNDDRYIHDSSLAGYLSVITVTN